MAESPELELKPKPPPGHREARQVWHLVTNQLNLMFIIAAGLLTGPKGFGSKYYRDPLCVAPGWIPLFADRIPLSALEQATSEGKHLFGVAAAIDLSPLRGRIQAVDDGGELRELQWPDEASGDERLLFVPAPLPIGWLQSILFPSREVKATFREQAEDYANVPINIYKQQVRKTLFQPDAGAAWPPVAAALPNRDHSVHRELAVGAVQALLVGLGNRGAALVQAARMLCEPSGTQSAHETDSLLNAVLQWAHGNSAPGEGEVQTRVLHRLLAAIVEVQVQADEAAGAWCAPDIHQTVLDTLEAERELLTEPKWRDALARLIGDLKGVLGLGDATTSELLKRHSRPFSRGLILFFLRKRCDELLALAAEQPMLTDQDLVVAAALFGAREGWMGLPQALKDTPGLTLATAHRMAAMDHRAQDRGLDLGPVPPRVQPLRERLQPGGSGWTKRQSDGALYLARAMGWQAVLKTRISLGRGDYRLQVDGRGAHLVVDGDVKAVQTEVDPALLFESLTQAAIPSKVEAEVRAALGL